VASWFAFPFAYPCLIRELSRADIGFAEIVVGVVTAGIEFGCLLELRFGQVQLAETGKVGGEIRAGSRGVGLQTHCLFEVQVGFGILCIR